jgi:hypothetical protein
MKKMILFITATAMCATTFAQSSWTMGLGLATCVNHSQYSGGMSDANARFTINPHGDGMWGVVFRKKMSDHFSFQTGLKFSQLGYNFAIAENYSFLKMNGHYTSINTGIPVLNVPATAIYNSNTNCRNYRWFVGVGASLTSSSKTINASKDASGFNETSQNTSSSDQLHADIHSSAFAVLNGQLLGGVEKIFKSGRMLSCALIWNKGFTPIATANVNYTIDGQNYHHTFTNYGNYWGLSLTYYLKPFKGKNANSSVSN